MAFDILLYCGFLALIGLVCSSASSSNEYSTCPKGINCESALGTSYEDMEEDRYYDSLLMSPSRITQEREDEHVKMVNWEPNVYQPPASTPRDTWTPDVYNIYREDTKVHHSGNEIQRVILNPLEFYPDDFARRIKGIRRKKKSEDDGKINVYHYFDANQTALYEAMREITTYDGVSHGIVLVPSKMQAFYNSNMSREEFDRRCGAGNLPYLTKVQVAGYPAWNFIKM